MKNLATCTAAYNKMVDLGLMLSALGFAVMGLIEGPLHSHRWCRSFEQRRLLFLEWRMSLLRAELVIPVAAFCCVLAALVVWGLCRLCRSSFPVSKGQSVSVALTVTLTLIQIRLALALASPIPAWPLNRSAENSCTVNLWRMAAAKHALENDKGLTNGSSVEAEDLRPYLLDPITEHWVCPCDPSNSFSTSYEIGPAGVPPKCRIAPEHMGYRYRSN